MRIKRVIRIVGHCIVYIRALMIEQFCIGHHSCVLEVLAKTTSDEMDMYPLDVLSSEGLHIEELWIF